jgi:hypothetical protein
MPQAQVSIDPWSLTYTNPDGYAGLNINVPAMAAQITYATDCDTGKLNISEVDLLNSDSLILGPVTQTYRGLGPTTPRDQQSYVTEARVQLSSFAAFVQVKVGLYWAECPQPQNQQGVPRFVLQARAGVSFNAQTTYITQKYTLAAGWAPPDANSITIPVVQVAEASNWSGLDEYYAHVSTCKKCLQMPQGAPKGVWQYEAPTTYAIGNPLPSPPAQGTPNPNPKPAPDPSPNVIPPAPAVPPGPKKNS